MKKEQDDITQLFKNKLSQSGITVEDHFWEHLNEDFLAAQTKKRILFYRVASSVAVFLVLAVTSAAFWMFTPQKEIEETINQLAYSNQSSLSDDFSFQSFKVEKKTVTSSSFSGNNKCVPIVHHPEDSVFISMSFQFSWSSYDSSNNHMSELNRHGNILLNHESKMTQFELDTVAVNDADIRTTDSQKYALKVIGGFSLPNKIPHHQLPFSVGVNIERQMNRILSIETGIQYSNISSIDKKLHFIGIPIRLNASMIKTSKVNLYASAGIVVDKCIAGAPNNSFKAEPIQVSIGGGVGLDYKIKEHLSAFIEPRIEHHFVSKSIIENSRTTHPTSFNLLAGIRMSF